MKKIISRAIAVAVFAGAAVTAQGEYVQRNTAPDVWADWNVNGWFSESSVARLPTADDDVYIHYNRDTFITDAQAAARLTMHFNVGGADLRIDNGGSLNVTAANGYDGVITLSGAGEFLGNPNVGNISVETGGTLTSGNTGIARDVIGGDAGQRGSLTLNGGSFVAQGTADSIAWLRNAEINLNSGAFDMTGTHALPVNVDMNIYGDQTTIDFGLLNTGAGSSAWNFAMDSDGISTVNIAGWYHLIGTEIVVDGTEYAGGTGEFVLFSGGSLASLPTTAATAQNFGGLEVSFGQVGNDYVMTVIPEPATLGLVLICGSGLLFLRRTFSI